MAKEEDRSKRNTKAGMMSKAKSKKKVPAEDKEAKLEQIPKTGKQTEDNNEPLH